MEGKARTTIRGYRESVTRLQEVGAEHGFPDQVEDFTVQHVYQFLGALRARGASRAYQHRLHREVKPFFSWCKRLDPGEQARTALTDYLEGVRGDDPGTLFLSMGLQRGMHSHALNVLFARLGKRAGVSRVHPHRFRHTFATWAIRS